MKRKRFIIVFSFLVVVILGAALWPREREPEYNGVKLSVWLERYKANLEPDYVSSDSHAALVQAHSAIREIGTNSLPFLVRWIQYKEPAWRKALYCGLGKVPDKVLRPRVSMRLFRWLHDKKLDRADNSMYAFQVLRQQAQPAVPELRRLARGKPINMTYYRAVVCLSMMGEDDVALEILAADRSR